MVNCLRCSCYPLESGFLFGRKSSSTPNISSIAFHRAGRRKMCLKGKRSCSVSRNNKLKMFISTDAFFWGVYCTEDRAKIAGEQNLPEVNPNISYPRRTEAKQSEIFGRLAWRALYSFHHSKRILFFFLFC